MQESLFGKTLEELSSSIRELGLPGYTAKQLSDWLYKKDALSFDEMTNLSKKARAQIASTYNLGTQAPIDVQESVDGTKKYLFPALPGKKPAPILPCDKSLRDRSLGSLDSRHFLR